MNPPGSSPALASLAAALFTAAREMSGGAATGKTPPGEVAPSPEWEALAQVALDLLRDAEARERSVAPAVSAVPDQLSIVAAIPATASSCPEQVTLWPHPVPTSVPNAGLTENVAEATAITDASAQMLLRSLEEWEAANAEAGWTPSPDQVEALTILREALAHPGTYILAGAAGTGKSSSVKSLLRMLTATWEVALLAPTWRAVNVLMRVVGREAQTIHSACYGKPVTVRRCTCGEWSTAMMKAVQVRYTLNGEAEQVIWDDEASASLQKEDLGKWQKAEDAAFALPRFVCPACKTIHEDATRFPEHLDFKLRNGAGGPTPDVQLVIVDEASMVRPQEQQAIVTVFRAPHVVIIYVGDPNQLPFVHDDREVDEAEARSDENARKSAAKGIDFDALLLEKEAPTAVFTPIDLTQPTAYLQVVHRQGEGDPILDLAQTLKTVPLPNKLPEWPFPFKLKGIHIQATDDLRVPGNWTAELRKARRDVALITYSNATRAKLNAAVREALGLLQYAAYYGQSVVAGDRLLARTTSHGVAVRNGELFDVVAVTQVTREKDKLINDASRAIVRRPRYEHDKTLCDGIGVFAVTIRHVGAPADEDDVVHIVTPIDQGKPLLESDLILSGMAPKAARERMRQIAYTWRDEYSTAIEELATEFSAQREKAETGLKLEARWRSSAVEDMRGTDTEARTGNLRKALLHVLRDLEAIGADAGAVEALREKIKSGDLDEKTQRAMGTGLVLRCYPALECNDLLAYARRYYNALDPASVCVFDYGEALTCHAMQGSQARHVGVVCDGGFYMAWREERVKAMKWLYTAVTRAEADLALFNIRKKKTQ